MSPKFQLDQVEKQIDEDAELPPHVKEDFKRQLRKIKISALRWLDQFDDLSDEEMFAVGIALQQAAHNRRIKEVAENPEVREAVLKAMSKKPEVITPEIISLGGPEEGKRPN